MFFKLVLASIFSFFTPTLDAFLEREPEMKVEELGWKAISEEPFFVEEKETWCVIFLLYGDRTDDGKLGHYRVIEDRGEKEAIFFPFTEKQVRELSRVAYYPVGSYPFHDEWYVSVTQVMRTKDSRVMYLVNMDPEE